MAHLIGSRCFWLWFYWFSFIFWLISIRALAMALLVSMLFSLSICAYIMFFHLSWSSYTLGWCVPGFRLLRSNICSCGFHGHFCGSSWPSSYSFWLFVFWLVFLCILIFVLWGWSLVFSSGWFLFFPLLLFSISFSHSSCALFFRIFLGVFFFSFRCHLLGCSQKTNSWRCAKFPGGI